MGNIDSKRKLMMYGGVLGVVGALLALMGNPRNMAICIACFIRDTAGAMKFHQAAVVQYVRPEIVGIVLGAFILSMATREYRSTAGSLPMIRFLLGVIMMIGSLAFLGCPLRMVIRMAAGDLNAYVALVGFGLGTVTGTVALKRGFSLGRAYGTRAYSGYILPSFLVVVLIASVATGVMAVSEKGPGSMHAPVLISLAGGLVFGMVSQRCRTCFAGGFRDLFLMRNYDLLTIIGGFFVVMLIYNMASGGFRLSFDGQPVAHSQHLWNILGMYAVGFAAVLAGGCPLRQLILAGQGSSDSAVTFLGLFVGAACCHNFGFAAAAAAAATETSPAVAGGLQGAGKAAVIVCIAVLFVIGFVPRKEQI